MDQLTPPANGDTPIGTALTTLTQALDEVISLAEHDGLAVLDDECFASFTQDLEKVRNRIGLVDHSIVHQADTRNIGHRWMMRNTTGWLRRLLHISPQEARGRLKAAEAITPRTTMLGESLPAQRPELAAAFRAGTLNPQQLNRAVDTLAALDRGGIDPADTAKAEKHLAELGTQFEPAEFKKTAEKMIEVHFPDGKLDDEHHRLIRNFYLKKNNDGSFTPGGRLTPALGAQLTAALTPLAKPQPAADGTADPRDPGQRLHDALEDATRRILASGELPHSGGTPATVIVTIDLEKLLAGIGHGQTTDVTLLTVDEILRLADEAEIIPAVFRGHNLPLNLGRSRRVANRNQTLALIARDEGCSFPGCTAPPEICERHHIVAWIRGGLTNINNLTLLCGYHHRNFAQTGWACTMINQLPHWIPPAWHDPDQTPQLHHRIRQRMHPTG